MSKILLKVACIAWLCVQAFMVQSFAQNDEIIVTGTRLERYSSETIPLITLDRKADFILLPISIINDTRNADMRSSELKKTVLGLIKAAKKRDDLELSVIVELEDDYDTISYPIPFTEEMFGEHISSGYRTDTSLLEIVIKTPVLDSDTTIEEPYERIVSFYEDIKLEGRTTMIDDGEPVLTIKNIEKYRTALLQDILKDVSIHRRLLGEESETRIDGLENTLRWIRTGELMLQIYIPYKLSYIIE